MTTTRTNKKIFVHIHLSGVAFHVHCVGLGCHVVIGVGRLIVRFHHAYAIPSFLLDVVVRLYLVIVNSDCSHNYCMLRIAKTGLLRCCPCTFRGAHWCSRAVFDDCCQERWAETFENRPHASGRHIWPSRDNVALGGPPHVQTSSEIAPERLEGTTDLSSPATSQPFSSFPAPESSLVGFVQRFRAECG